MSRSQPHIVRCTPEPEFVTLVLLDGWGAETTWKLLPGFDVVDVAEVMIRHVRMSMAGRN